MLIACTALLATLLTATLTAQNPTKPYQHQEGLGTVLLPEDWVQTGIKEDEDSTTWSFESPEVESRFHLQLYHVKRPQISALERARNTHKFTFSSLKGKDARFEAKPLPHYSFSYRSGGNAWIRMTASRRERGHGFNFYFDCTPEDYAKLHDDFVSAVQSLKFEPGRYPPEPTEGFTKTKEGSIEFIAKDGVTKKQVRVVMRDAKRIQKNFEKICGPLTRPADEPLQIYIAKNLSDLRPVFENVTKTEDGFYRDDKGRRFFASTFNPETRMHELFAYNFTRMLFVEKYGHGDFRWIRVGLATHAGYAARYRLRLPAVVHNWNQYFARRTLDNLGPLLKANWDHYYWDGAVYVAFFLVGPSKYKKAFTALLHELEAGKTYDEALAIAFKGIDLKKLRSKVEPTLRKKLKPKKL